MRRHFKPTRKNPKLACKDKKTYKSTREARRIALIRIAAQTVENLYIYFCESCRGYHLSKVLGNYTLEEVAA